MRVVVALGGNALLKRGEPMTAETQRDNVRTAAPALAPVAGKHQLVLSHGNGPQVGLLALQAAAYTEVEAYPLDVLGAQTEGMIGYVLEQELGNLLPFEVPFATILTMIEVDPADPAFKNPTKFVGPVYDKAQADQLAAREGVGLQAGRGPLAAGGPLTRAQADLRDPAHPLAAGQGRRRHLRRRRRHPHHVSARRRAHPGRGRGGDRQGPGQRAAGPRGRGRPVRHGHRRRRRLHRLGHARPAQARTGHARPSCASCSSPPGRWDPRSRRRCRFVEATGKRAAIGGLDEIEEIVDGDAGTQVVAR